jgi:hypothetical protein
VENFLYPKYLVNFMADFCKECSEHIFGKDYGDLKGLCNEDEVARVICEGCGITYVDHLGKCDGKCLNPEHNLE